MLFPSIEFVFLFLPLSLAVYYSIPQGRNLRNYWLLAASLVFYAWGEPRFVFVLLASAFMNYLAALGIEALRERGRPRAAKCMLAVAVAANLSLVGTWKYANFLTGAVREFFPSWQGVVPQTSFLLPIGISFFTFQSMSYVIDVSRGMRAQRNPLLLALYVALFPQLVAGPIVRYSTVAEQITSRQTTWERFSGGVFRFVAGFNKKVLIANVMAEVADRAFAAGGATSAAFAWLGAFCYAFQIYFDFSGYSDMAIGLGRMFGFEFLENFNYPYVSKTVTEFWRRWHISLGSWFRDYVYIPMGGNRVSRPRLVFNLAVVWGLTGLWHGANWTFIAWGAFYGALLVFEKLTGIAKSAGPSRMLGVVYRPLVLLLVLLGWVLFRSDTISSAASYASAMFGSVPLVDGSAVFWSREIAVPFLCAAVGSAPVLRRVGGRVAVSAGYALQFALFWLSVSCLVMKSHNPFIYFNF